MFQQAQKQIQQWHIQQGHTNELTQQNKLIEELGEVAKELGQNNEQALKTELGDVLIVLISLDQINKTDRDLTPFLNAQKAVCENKLNFFVLTINEDLAYFNTVTHGIELIKHLGYCPTECLVLAWSKEQAKTITSKPTLINSFEFISRHELLLNDLIIFGDNETVNFMPETAYQPRELKTSPMKLGNVEPNRWFVMGRFACLVLSIIGIDVCYQTFELKENGGFETRVCSTNIDSTVNLIH